MRIAASFFSCVLLSISVAGSAGAASRSAKPAAQSGRAVGRVNGSSGLAAGRMARGLKTVAEVGVRTFVITGVLTGLGGGATFASAKLASHDERVARVSHATLDSTLDAQNAARVNTAGNVTLIGAAVTGSLLVGTGAAAGGASILRRISDRQQRRRTR